MIHNTYIIPWQVGVDGWRLDVAHELPPSFWRDFRSACTEVKYRGQKVVK